MPNEKHYISIIEDDPQFLEALLMLIDVDNSLQVISSFTNAEQALEDIGNNLPDVVIVDINLPKLNGIQCLASLKAQFPKLLFLICSSYEDGDKIFESLKAGASGYILKTDGATKITTAIKDLLDGGSPMSAQIARKVVESFNANQAKNLELTALTKKEIAVLELLSKGFLSKEVADGLSMSTGTVRKHIQHIYEKLHVNTRVEAVNLFLKR